MRIFTAIDFDIDTKKKIDEIKNTLKNKSIKGNFSDTENIHLTLKFMGEVDKEALDEICRAVFETSQRFRPFDIKLSGIGFFQREAGNHIAWISVSENKLLQKLFDDLDKTLSKYGFRREKGKYTPHVTIGREVKLIRSPKNTIEEINTGEIVVKANKITVFHSTRIGSKLVYKPVFEGNFKEK